MIWYVLCSLSFDKQSLTVIQEKKFKAAGIASLVINKDTTSTALTATPPLDIWDAAPTVEVLLLSPEQLASPSFAVLLKNKEYQARVVALGVDEAHLLNTWGQSFRRDFEQIGLMRARFEPRPLLIALTATLQCGPWLRSVCHFLGLHDNHYHLIRRSNMRYDIRFIFRTVRSGARSHEFPELDWVLEGDRRIIVFCPTISLGFRVATYLHARSDGLDGLEDRIRMYNGLNWASYNAETLSFMREDNRSRVTVATDSLAVGIDVAGTDDIVLYDTVLPPNTDVILQKAGRIRDGRGRDSRVVIYLPKNAASLATAALDGHETRKTNSKGAQRTGSAVVDHGVAQLVLASCKVELLNELYDNPPEEIPCHCPTCTAKPVVTRPEQCTCSGCSPEDPEAVASIGVRPRDSSQPAKPPAVPPEQKITRAMQDYGYKRLVRYRKTLREGCDECLEDLYPPEEFLPDSLIDTVVNKLYNLPDTPSVKKALPHHPVLEPHHASLLVVLVELRADFDKMRIEAKEAKAAKARATREKNRAAAQADAMEIEAAAQVEDEAELEASGTSDSESDTSMDESEAGRGEADGGDVYRLMIRIPGGRFQKN